MKKIIIALVAFTLTGLVSFAAQNRVQDAGIINWTNPAAAVSSGALVKIGDQYGVALTDIASNVTGAVAMEGVYIFTIATNSTATFGTKLYYSNATTVSTTAAAGTYAGVAVETITVDSTKIKVLLNAPVNEDTGSAATLSKASVTVSASPGFITSHAGVAAPTNTATRGVTIRVNGTNYVVALYPN
jgi:predicted RecA/RadA family phage recombinase